MKTMDSGLKPVRMIVNIISKVAMEFREAKKFLVVEKRPIRTKAKVGRLMSGDKKTLSGPLFQAKIVVKPLAIL